MLVPQVLRHDGACVRRPRHVVHAAHAGKGSARGRRYFPPAAWRLPATRLFCGELTGHNSPLAPLPARSATNGIDAARRLNLCGFCFSTEQLFERVEETVLRRGGEIFETRRQLKRWAVLRPARCWALPGLPDVAPAGDMGAAEPGTVPGPVWMECWCGAVFELRSGASKAQCQDIVVGCRPPMHLPALPCLPSPPALPSWQSPAFPHVPPHCSGVHEVLHMSLAIPLLFGVPPEYERLKRGVIQGGGVIESVQRQWLIY